MKDHKDQLAHKVILVLLDQQDNKDRKVSLAPPVPKDPRVNR